jgi:site-specific DNA recombinase
MPTITTPDDKPANDEGAQAVIYLRVSTKEQAEMGGEAEGYSIPAQRDACLRKAASLKAVVVEEFVDRGESARSADRPELQKLLQYVSDQAVSYVIVHKVDRLARNRADDVTINLLLQKAGVQLVSVTENIDETPSGMLLHGIMSSIAEFYSRNLASEVIKGSVQKAKSGGTPGKAPTGYLNVRSWDSGREVRSVEVDPVRGPIMAWAFEAYATGDWTIRDLLEEVTKRGLDSTPSPKHPSQPLQISHFHTLLRHPYYMGVVRYRGVLYQGKHQPLVTNEVWQAVQDHLTASNHAGEKRRVHPHYLKGSVFCGQCGSSLIISYNKNRFGTVYPYFVCVGRHQKRTLCTQRAVRIDQVEEAIIDYYSSVQLTDEQIVQIRAYVIDEMLKMRKESDRERGVQELRLRKLLAERKSLLDAHYAGAVPLDLLKSEQTRIGLEMTATQSRLDAVSQHFELAEANLKKTLALVGDCRRAYQEAPNSVRRQFNQALFKKLLIDDIYDVRAELAEPFDILLGSELRQAAAQKAELELGQAVDQVLEGRQIAASDNKKDLAMVGATDRSFGDPGRSYVQGVKYETMVPLRGFEPLASP